MTKKIRICFVCKNTNVNNIFIKKRNICRECSLKALTKYHYKINKTSRENIKKYAKKYYNNLSDEEKKKKIKRVNFLAKKRKIKKRIKDHLIFKHSLNVKN